MTGGFRTRGQPAALASIARSVVAGQAPHALLLVGPAGVGKTTLALDLAAGLLCLAPEPTERPCRVCAGCRKVEHGNHPDLHRLAPHGAGEQIQIGDVRRLLAELALRPFEGRVRLALVEQAPRLNQDGQNALLKVLEEPPAGVTIVLTAEADSLLLETVVSRCQGLRLGPVEPSVIADLLVAEGLADASRAAELARLAAGRPGIAIALARDPQGLLVEGRLLRRLLDLASADRRARLGAAAELVADAAALAGSATQDVPPGGQEHGEPVAGEDDELDGPAGASRRPAPLERRRAALRLLGAWRDLARDLAIVSAGGRAQVRRLDLLEELDATAATLGPLGRRDLAGFLARLDGLAAGLEGYANPELVVDVLLLSWPRAERTAA